MKLKDKLHSLLLEYAEKDLTDKASNHAYEYFYPEELSIFESTKDFALLEIGVSRGASLEIWAQAFPEGQIYGVDRDFRLVTCQIERFPNIHLLAEGLQNNPATFKKVWEDDLMFDVIIDDASHAVDDQIVSWNILKSRLKPGGIYVIEDCFETYPLKPDKAIDEKYPEGFLAKFEIIDLRHLKNRHDDMLLVHRA